MKNLKKETLDALEAAGKDKKDILWIGGSKYGQFSFEDFLKISDFEYNSGFGGQEVAKDLVVVGEDWWLERAEYDGSEWWDYKTLPDRPNNQRIPEKLSSDDSWATLEEINRPGGKYQE